MKPFQEPLFRPTATWRPPTELPSLRGVKRLAFDLETKDSELKTKGIGVRRPGNYVVGLGVGTGDGRRFYFPTRHEGGGNLDEKLVWNWARAELNAFDGEVVGAALPYDLDWAAEYGVTFSNVRALHDVQVAEVLIDEWRDEYNLDVLSRDYLGVGKEHELLAQVAVDYGLVPKGARAGSKNYYDGVKENLWRLPAAYVGAYAEADVDRPLRVFELQERKLAEEDLFRAYAVERQLIPIVVAMRRAGVRVNVAKAERLRAELVKRRDRYVAELKRLAGPTAELLEPAALGRALEARGIDVAYTPKNLQPSITKAFLEQHKTDELVQVILKGRQLNTLINTFVDGQILGHAVNGRVHPTWRTLKDDDGGTIGRFSGATPNLQFIPSRDEELAPLVRGVFEPEPGEEWQRDDCSQIEYRFLAHYAVGPGADAARAAYAADPKTDFHKLAATMLGVDPEDKVRRKRVKNTNFCKVYGGGIPKIATTFDCTEEEAAAFVAVYDEKLPFVQSTFDAAEKWARKRGYVTTILGRRQRFPFWGPRGYQRKKPAKLFRSREDAADYYVTGVAARRRDPDRLYRGYPVRYVERADTYTALNKKLQISAAELLKKSMVDAWNAGICAVTGPYKVTVHDELGTSIPPTRAGDEAGRELTRIMERAVELRVPVLVESGRGRDWGEVS